MDSEPQVMADDPIIGEDGSRTYLLRRQVNLSRVIEQLSADQPYMSVLEKYNLSRFQDLLPGDVIHVDDLKDLVFTLSWIENKTFMQHVYRRKRTRDGRDVFQRIYTCCCCPAECRFESTTGEFYSMVRAPVHPQSSCTGCDTLYGPPSPQGAAATILKNLPCVNTAARNFFDNSAKLVEVQSALESANQWLGKIPKTTFQKIVDDKRKLYLNSATRSYINFSLYLEQFCRLNPRSTAAVQLDTEGRFMRAFLLPGQILVLWEKGILQEVLAVDCGFSKTLYYDGVYRFGVSRLGTGQNMPVYMAAGAIEDTRDMAWDAMMCEKAGVQIENLAVPMDRGGMLSAARVLSPCVDLTINSKHCNQHLIRNVNEYLEISTTGETATQVRRLVLDYCYADSMQRAVYCLTRIPSVYVDVEEQARPYMLMAYLAKLDPIHFMHVANVPHVWKEAEFLQTRITCLAESYQFGATLQTRQERLAEVAGGDDAAPDAIEHDFIVMAEETLGAEPLCPPGKRMPLFGGDTSNMVESQMSSSISNGIRTSIPPEAFAKWVRCFAAVLENLRQDMAGVNALLPQAMVPIATNMWTQKINSLDGIQVVSESINELDDGTQFTVMLKDTNAHPSAEGIAVSVLFKSELENMSIRCDCTDCFLNQWTCKWRMKAF